MIARADDEAIALSDRAQAIGDRFADLWTTANSLITKGTALRNLGGRDEGRALLERGLTLAKEGGLAEVALRAYNNLLIAGDMDPVARERLLEEGIAYAERHGLEQPMLAAGRAFAAFVRGDWDESLALAERIPAGSFWHEQTAGWGAMVALGRQGPSLALPMARRRAGEAMPHTEGQRIVGPLGQMMLVSALAGERAECETWSRELLRRAHADPGVARALAAGPVSLALAGAAYLGEPAWIDLVAAAVPPGEDGEATSELLRATRAFLAGDAATCGSAIATYCESMLARGWGVPPIALSLARELRRSGVPLGPEWDRPLGMLREYAERGRAEWFLAELDKIAAKA